MLRFYRWAKPTASIGYSQPVEKIIDLEYCVSQGLDVVRRITGGKLVLHDREITYSLCSADATTFSATLAESYRLISEAIVRGLRRMGLSAGLAGPPPPSYSRGRMPCFAYPARDEIEIAGRKLVGSAQKRIGPRFLQHGSIPLEAEPDRLAAAAGTDGAEVRLISLSEALGRPADFAWCVGHLVEGFAEYFRASLTPSELSSADVEEALRLERERYADPEWNLAGRPDAK